MSIDGEIILPKQLPGARIMRAYEKVQKRNMNFVGLREGLCTLLTFTF